MGRRGGIAIHRRRICRPGARVSYRPPGVVNAFTQSFLIAGGGGLRADRRPRRCRLREGAMSRLDVMPPEPSEERNKQDSRSVVSFSRGRGTSNGRKLDAAIVRENGHDGRTAGDILAIYNTLRSNTTAVLGRPAQVDLDSRREVDRAMQEGRLSHPCLRMTGRGMLSELRPFRRFPPVPSIGPNRGKTPASRRGRHHRGRGIGRRLVGGLIERATHMNKAYDDRRNRSPPTTG